MSKKNKKQSLSDSDDDNYLQVILTQNDIVIKPNPKTTGISLPIRINRETKEVEQAQSFKPTGKKLQEFHSYAFLGFLPILKIQFLLFCSEYTEVCILNDQEILEIQAVQLIPLDPKIKMEDLSKPVKQYIDGIYNILKDCHYFSYGYPLSLRLNQILGVDSKNQKEVEERYSWNHNLLKNQIPNIDKRWDVQMIQGFVGYFEISFNINRFQFYLITRRCKNRGGTRFINRGADAEGNVANFSESEQVICCNGIYTSSVQVRGSIPLLWEQVGKSGQVVRFSSSEQMSRNAFRKHFQFLNDNYKSVQIVNILKEEDKVHSLLIKEYEDEIYVQQTDLKLLYQFIEGEDFKENLNEQITKYRKGGRTTQFKFFAYSQTDQKVLQHQQGAFRINSMDCLDNVNSYMMKVGMTQFEEVLSLLQVDLSKELNGNPVKRMDQKDIPQFIEDFKQLWQQSGSNVSQIYAGEATNRLKQKFAKFGIEQNEGHRQECIDLVSGTHINSSLHLSKDVTEQLLKEAIQYKTVEQDIYIVNLCVNSASLEKPVILPNFFSFDTEEVQDGDRVDDELEPIMKEQIKLPAFIAVALTEIIEFSKAKMFKKHDLEMVEKWKQAICMNLEQLEEAKNKYVLIDQHDMHGNVLFIFALQKITEDIQEIYHDNVKDGFMNQVAKYGCVNTHIKYLDQNLCFVNVCLPSGRGKWDKRIETLEKIHQNAFQKKGTGKTKKMKLQDHDIVFLFGDFNFRVECEWEESQKMIKECKTNNLASIFKFLGYDEYIKRKYSKGEAVKNCLMHYFEQDIRFLPTFNDTSKKQRANSWRHRIFIYHPRDEQLVNHDTIKYNSIEDDRYQDLPTDHRPVYGLFNMKFRVKDQTNTDLKLEELVNQKNKEYVIQQEKDKKFYGLQINDDDYESYFD